MKPLITFEGGEGAGKTTLIRSLASKLEDEGRKVLCTRAPGSLKIGVKIRDLLLHSSPDEVTPKTELFLFLADRSSHVERKDKEKERKKQRKKMEKKTRKNGKRRDK